MVLENLKLTTKERKLLDGLAIGTEDEEVANMFSKEKVTLCPEAVAVHDFIKGCEVLGDHTGVANGLGIFMNNWPEEYMVLLD